MVRSSFVVVSDDQLFIQKCHQFAMTNGATVKVMTPQEWDAMNTGGSTVPSLVSGAGQTDSTGHSTGTAKVLPFPGTPGYAPSTGDSRRSVVTIDQVESVAIENAIAAFKGNLTEAAKALGIGRATLYRKVKAYNIDPSMARKKKAA